MTRNTKKSDFWNSIQSNTKKRNIAEYVIIFLAITIVFILCKALGIKNDNDKTQILMIASLFGLMCYACYLGMKKQLTTTKIMQIIIFAGIIMRVGYTIYTHMFVRGNDLGEFSTNIHENGCGHLGYIYYIVENGKLPDGNSYQLYHPPLYHILSAIAVQIAGIFIHSGDMQSKFEFIQIINCTLACIMLPMLRNFLNEIYVDKKYAPWAMAIVAFFPTFYQMGGRLNNDMAVTFFMFLCIVNTYRWYRKRDMKTVVYIALCFGLGMMSKISCGIMALFTGMVMLVVLYEEFKNKNAKQIIIQFVVFAAVCVPLALWYPVRNYILFDQPFNYVPRIEENNFVYRGNVSWTERLFSFSSVDLAKQPFVNLSEDNNVIMTMLRTALYGEAEFGGRNFAASIANIVNLLLVVVSLAAMIYVLIKNKKVKSKAVFGVFVIWLIIFGSFVQFNVAYPALCTANYRYIPLATVMGGVFIAYALSYMGDRHKYVSNSIKIMIIVWCIFTSVVYL